MSLPLPLLPRKGYINTCKDLAPARVLVCVVVFFDWVRVYLGVCTSVCRRIKTVSNQFPLLSPCATRRGEQEKGYQSNLPGRPPPLPLAPCSAGRQRQRAAKWALCFRHNFDVANGL